MHGWKVEFLFVWAPNEVVTRRYRYFSRTPTNTGRKTSLELESSFEEELVEYFTIVEYSKPNNSSFKVPSHWIPLKEIFYDDNLLVANGFRLAEDRGLTQNFLK